MRTRVGTLALLVVSAIGAVRMLSHEAAAQERASHPVVTRAEYERWQRELSNWGRWGKDDELGTLNLVTPAKRKAAAALVKEGVAVSLAANVNTTKGIDVPCPAEWAMVTASDAGVRETSTSRRAPSAAIHRATSSPSAPSPPVIRYVASALNRPAGSACAGAGCARLSTIFP